MALTPAQWNWLIQTVGGGDPATIAGMFAQLPQETRDQVWAALPPPMQAAVNQVHAQQNNSLAMAFGPPTIAPAETQQALTNLQRQSVADQILRGSPNDILSVMGALPQNDRAQLIRAMPLPMRGALQALHQARISQQNPGQVTIADEDRRATLDNLRARRPAEPVPAPAPALPPQPDQDQDMEPPSDSEDEPSPDDIQPGIPPSRLGSVDSLVKQTQEFAQRKKIKKTHDKVVSKFNSGLEDLNKKPGRSFIPKDKASEYYEQQAQKPKNLPEELSALQRAREEALARERGFDGATALKRARAEALARERGFEDPAALHRAQAEALASKRGLDGPTALHRAQEEALASKRGLDGPAALQRARRAAQKAREAEGLPAGASGGLETEANLGEGPSAPRPIVRLAGMGEAAARSWNAGDRFEIPGPDGQPQLIQVNYVHIGGDQFSQGELTLILRGG